MVRTIRLRDNPKYRIVHFTDTHHKGDTHYLKKVMGLVNAQAGDLVCFTGDLVEDSVYLSEALDEFARVQRPMYGVPGNWDRTSGASFKEIDACFRATGGGWLVDQEADILDGAIHIVGRGARLTEPSRTTSGPVYIHLTHYPAQVDELPTGVYGLTLAGHSHGGQARLPIAGALQLPHGVGPYDRGLFHTKAGPLYVNPGIGTFMLDVRFLCRPEITVFEI